MLAAALKNSTSLRWEDVPKPELDPGEILVRIKSCGICATDS
jgi:D-arabinose 1-dehydrogenase-like Zn-dependent alcohol dehydrogenase